MRRAPLIGVVLLAGLLSGCGAPAPQEQAPQSPSSSSAAVEPTPSPSSAGGGTVWSEQDQEDWIQYQEQSAGPAAPESSGEPVVSVEQAIQDHLDYAPLSRAYLIEELVGLGFDQAEAEQAVDQAGVDWVDQARRRAAKYQEFTTLSGPEMVDQLVRDGFTPEQAQEAAGPQG